MYGTSGHNTIPPGSVISSYTLHNHPFQRGGNSLFKQVKMITKTSECLHFQIHACDLMIPGTFTVNTRMVRRLPCFPPLTLGSRGRCLQEPFSYYRAGKLRYPMVVAYSGMWMNHYFTRSMQEWGFKNERGDAQANKRESTIVPDGLDDMVSYHIIDSVKARLDLLAESEV